MMRKMTRQALCCLTSSRCLTGSAGMKGAWANMHCRYVKSASTVGVLKALLWPAGGCRACCCCCKASSKRQVSQHSACCC